MSDTFHAAAPDELDGLALARLVSRLGVEAVSPATFLWDGNGSLSQAFELWLAGSFGPVLAPALIEVHRLATAYRLDEIAAIDRRIDASLDVVTKTRSLAAAKAFLEGKDEMKANREWTRFAGLVARGTTPGHTATLFALQTALYHLPLVPALAAYAWFELESGLPRAYRDLAGTREEVLRTFAATLPHVRVAMERDRDEFADGFPHLRAI
jgi:urease accessory protein UreF